MDANKVDMEGSKKVNRDIVRQMVHCSCYILDRSSLGVEE
jgi:hypothetical protein